MTKMPRTIVASASLLLAACDSTEAPAPAPQPPSPPSVAAPQDAAEAGSPDAAAEAGSPEAGDDAGQDGGEAPKDRPPDDIANAAFFDVRDKGVVTLTDSGFATVPGSENEFIDRFRFGADGKLYAKSSSDIVAVSTGGLTSVAPLSYDELGSVADFDVGAEGEVWVVGTNGVSVYREGAWSTESKSAIGLSEEFAVGIALDSEGEPWAATNDSIVHRSGGKWEPASLPSGPTKYLDKMRRGPDGQVYLSTYDRLFRLTGTPERVRVKMGAYESPGAVSFSQSTYGAAKGLESASIFLPADQAVLYRKKDLKIGTLSAVAVDDQGRLWAAGDGGIAIAGPGDARVTWPSGSMEEVAGQISNLVVRGQGPKLPEAGEVKKGGLKGQILKEGEGVAGVKIELCESPSMIYTRTPCSGAPTHLRGKTDAEGNFVFEDVPLGAYGIAIKQGSQWKITLGAALGTRMVEGEIYDIGSVELK